MNRKNLLLATLALLLVLLGNWLAEQGVKQVDRRLAPEAAAQQDYYLNDVIITAMDEQGRLQHRLQARQLSHYTTRTQTELQQVDLEVLDQGKVAWRVMAERGQINQQQDLVLLQEKVRLTQPDKGAPLQLTTTSLRIRPKQGRAESDRAVTLTQGNTRIDAVGMQIDQQEQRLVLLSQVRGRYEALTP